MRKQIYVTVSKAKYLYVTQHFKYDDSMKKLEQKGIEHQCN